MKLPQSFAGWLYWGISAAVVFYIFFSPTHGRNAFLLWQWADDPILRGLIKVLVFLFAIALIPGYIGMLVLFFLGGLAVLAVYLLYSLATASITGAILSCAIVGAIVALLFKNMSPRASVHKASSASTSFSSGYSASDRSVTTLLESDSPQEENDNNNRGLFEMTMCPDCDGRHLIIPDLGDGICHHCHGDGFEPGLVESAGLALSEQSQKCSVCHGDTGCQTCNGKGCIRA
jgi:hypothetical protein